MSLKDPIKRKIYHKQWRDKNRAQLNEKNRLWKLKNPEKVKEEYTKNKRKYIERVLKWNKKNPEKKAIIAKKSWKKWYEKMKIKNPEYFYNARHKRRLIKLNVGGNHTLGEWEILKAQYNWTCLCCGKKEPEIKLTEDHIIPLSKGGSNNIENIQPLCRKCNCRKYNKTIKYGKNMSPK